jgi:hypothetical protein
MTSTRDNCVQAIPEESGDNDRGDMKTNLAHIGCHFVGSYQEMKTDRFKQHEYNFFFRDLFARSGQK